MSNASILSAIDTLVGNVTTDLATLASAVASVASIQASLATAQGVVATDLSDTVTSPATLAARLPAEEALVSVYQAQLAAAQLAVKTAQAQVYSDATTAGSNAQSVARQWRSFQRSADESTLLSFVNPLLMRLGSVAVYDVLAASAADSTIAGFYAQFATQNVAMVQQEYPNIVNLSANWNTFKTAFNAVVGCTLVATG
jgi:hypothetical protein